MSGLDRLELLREEADDERKRIRENNIQVIEDTLQDLGFTVLSETELEALVSDRLADATDEAGNA